MSYDPHNAIITVKPNDDVFIECFLIDGQHLNDKGWKVSYDSEFDKIVQSSIGHPLVLYERTLPNGEKVWDHPVSETGSVTDDIVFQKPYVVGKAVHNKKIRDGLWNSTYKIVHEGAKRFLKSVKESSIDLFTSLHIVRPVLEDRQNIKRWAIIHNAIVSNPANGKQKAKVASICEGDPAGACSSLFASMDSPEKQYGYCLGDSLKEYVTSHSLKTENSSYMSETQSTTTATAEPNQTSIPPPSGNNQQQLLQQNKEEEGNESTNEIESANKTIAELKEKIKGLESQNQAQNSSNDQISKQENRIKELEKKLELRDRTANIEKLLTQAIALYTDENTGSVNEKEYNTDLDKLVKSNHSIDEIQELIQAKYVLHQHAKGKLTVGNKASNTSPDRRDSFSSQVSESASRNYTEMNDGGSSEQDSSTTNNESKKLSQGYVNVLNHINNERLTSRSKFGGIN